MSSRSRTFISYASADRAFAHRLGADLRAAGAEVWLDQLDVRPGEVWEDEQARALAGSDCLLAILTPAAVSSPAVLDDIRQALAGGKAVLPLLKEPCELPPELRTFKSADFTADYPLNSLLEPNTFDDAPPRSVSRTSMATALGILGAIYGAICEYSIYARYVATRRLPESALVDMSLLGALVSGSLWALTGFVCGAAGPSIKTALAAAAAVAILWIFLDSGARVDRLEAGLIAASPLAGLVAALLTRIGRSDPPR